LFSCLLATKMADLIAPPDDCSICLLPLQKNLITTVCGHCFHLDCQDHWLAIQGDDKTCALCRGVLTPSAPQAIYLTEAEVYAMFPDSVLVDICYGHIEYVQDVSHAVWKIDAYFVYGCIPEDWFEYYDYAGADDDLYQLLQRAHDGSAHVVIQSIGGHPPTHLNECPLCKQYICTELADLVQHHTLCQEDRQFYQ
jgi:hypothetical protein